MYAAQIRGWTSLDLSAKQIHTIGVEDLERIQEERREAATRLGFRDPPAALAEFDASGRNRARSRQEMLSLALSANFSKRSGRLRHEVHDFEAVFARRFEKLFCNL